MRTDSSINVNEINKLILEISDTRNDIKIIFNKINELLSESKQYYSCKSATSLRQKYSLFNDNYKIILSNLDSYKRDLQILKTKYSNSMEDLSEKIKSDSSKIIDVQTYKERW